MSSSTTTEGCNTCRISRDFEILRNTELFASTSTEIVKLFAYLSKRRRFQPGEAIVTQGKQAGSAYFILKGDVEITTHYKDKEVTLQSLKESSIFGELALLARFDWFFSAKATSPAEILVIDRESFRKIIDKYPEKRDQIIEKLIKLRIARFEHQNTLMLDQLYQSQTNEESIETSFVI